MISRRQFIATTLPLIGYQLFRLNKPASCKTISGEYANLIMPEESSPHSRTWMAFVANDNIWSLRQIPEVKRNLALIAKTIAKYEPVSMLVNPDEHNEAADLLGGVSNHKFQVTLIKFPIDDLWLRDTGPTFTHDQHGQKYGVDFNFNGWGNKQQHKHDKKVAAFISQQSSAHLKTTDAVLEGGCFEVDGQSTAILTKSCVLNNNRNPHMSQAEIEEVLSDLLGLKKIIWLNGIKGKDITDGHTDFYARFSSPGNVLVSRETYKASYDYKVTRENIEILKRATDAQGRKLNITLIDTPTSINENYGTTAFAAGYIGYYVCNGAVIMQRFGDKKADSLARRIIGKAYPGRKIEQIRVDGIASGGGSIHCTTQQEPLLRSF